MDLIRCEALIIAIIPLHEIGFDPHGCAESSPFAGFPGALEWTAQHQLEGHGGQSGLQSAGRQLALGIERNIGVPRVTAGSAPFRFAVTDQKNLLGHGRAAFRHGISAAR